ncbi:MAG: flagellar biosynthesis protein FlhB [Desulfobacterales bacterium]
MSQDTGMEKTEKATPRKRRKAREKGQVAQSREIPSVMILLTSLGIFYFAGAWMFEQLEGTLHGSLSGAIPLNIETIAEADHLAKWCFASFFRILLPMAVPLVVIGIVANVAQFGFLFKESFLVPDLKKVFSLSGFKRLFSLKSLVELLKSLFKILFVGGIAYAVVKGELDRIPSLVQLDILGVLSYLAGTSFKIVFFVCMALLVLAAGDFAYQRWQHEKELRMTKQEVKEEHKQSEGDPKVKSRIRKAQMEMARKRMMEMVPTADVVVTNPTHFAVALTFDAKVMDAPTVVAKGADHMAARIRKVASDNGVPIVENKPLARSLYKVAEIGDAIPVELYKAVAGVLAYVYRLKGKGHPS